MRTKTIKISNAASLLILALSLSACGGDGGPTSSDEALSLPVAAIPTVTSTPTPNPTVTAQPSPNPTVSPSPSPSPSASPTLTVLDAGTNPYIICGTFAEWNPATTSIEIVNSGDYYTYTNQGVTVTYTTGYFNGQTHPADPGNETEILRYGGDPNEALCTVTITNSVVTNFTNNEQGV